MNYNFTEMAHRPRGGSDGYNGIYVGKGGITLSKTFMTANPELFGKRVRIMFDKVHEVVALVVNEKEGWRVTTSRSKLKDGTPVITGSTVGNKGLVTEVGRGRFIFDERDGTTYIFKREEA